MLRAYIKSVLLLSVGLMLAVSSYAATSAAPLFIEGRDYIRLARELRASPVVEQLLLRDQAKIQVLFFFSYGCHACERLRGPFEQWRDSNSIKANTQVAVYKYPVSYNPQWRMLAKLYYVMENMGNTEQLSSAIFESIHKRSIKLWEEASMKDFFVQHRYSAKDFEKAYNSFSVNRQVKQADELSKSYKISETPDIIVNGPVDSYRVSIARVSGDTDKLFKILNYLVSRENKLLAKS